MADFPLIIDLTNLDGAAGFIVQGDTAVDRVGFSVSDAGDVNGDGFADIVLGAPFGDDGGVSAGEAYVIFGKASGFGSAFGGRRIIDLTTLDAANGFIIQGQSNVPYDESGRSVSDAGDVNGDGFDDILVGTPRSDNGGTNAGDTFVVFGRATGFGASVGGRQVIALGTLDATNGFIIEGGMAFDRAGASVSDAGDVNGDGFDDILVGAPFAPYGYSYPSSASGQAYVIFGKAAGFGSSVGGRQTIDLAALDATSGFVIQGDAAADNAGYSVSGAGDVNGDGFADILVGARFGSDGGMNAGEAYVIFGKASGFGSPIDGRRVIDLASLNAASGFIIQGDAAGDQAGYSVSGAGDVNGDGFDDILVGARYGDDGGDSAGEAYVIFGKAGGFGNTVGGRQVIDLTTLDAANGFIVQGDALGDRAGYSVSGAGDVNGDGFDDILVGAIYGAGGGSLAGATYVIFGKAGGFGSAVGGRQVIDLTALDASNGFIIQGDEADDLSSRSVSGAGDVNGDGFADILVGAPSGDDGGNNTGEGYVVFGRAPTAAVNRVGSAGSQQISGGAFDDTLSGEGGDDTLIGGLGDDIINGNAGNDTIFGQGGEDTIDGGADNDRVEGFTKEDSVLGGSGDDTLFGNGDTDTLDGGGGDDRLFGGVDNDTLLGGNGADFAKGAGGDDRIEGGSGDDELFGGADQDRLFGDNGNDTLNGNSNRDTLKGGGGDDELRGNNGNDRLEGEAGNDNLFGGAGDDTIIGGAGIDTLAGRANADRFIFEEGDTGAAQGSADLITDFSQGDGDRIVLSAIDAITGGGDSAFTFIGDASFSGTAGELRYRHVDGETRIFGDVDGDGVSDIAIRLSGTIDLVAADFVL